MEVKSPIGVEEWEFVQSALVNETGDSLHFDSNRNQQLPVENQSMEMVGNKRLKTELKPVVRVKPIDMETTAWIAKLENENLQLHKMWKDQMTKRLDLKEKLQRLDSARTKQLKESKRLRKICLHQAATLIDVHQIVYKQNRNTLRVIEQKKIETMEQWLMIGLKNGRKRSLETETVEAMLTKPAKRLKKVSPMTETEEINDESRARVVVEKAMTMQEDMTASLIMEFWSPDVEAPEMENDVWTNLPEEFGLFEEQLDIDLMVAELTTNFDWHVERSHTG